MGLCAKEVQQVKVLQKRRRMVFMRYHHLDDSPMQQPIKDHYLHLLRNLTRAIFQIVYVEYIPPNRTIVEARTINSFSEAECWQNFRIRRNKLENNLGNTSPSK